ncbi:WD repeat-containing protein 75 [Hylaeus anthracinus]|uniref:WD repeat-containing protein 75 n=1 Tax=Hylaeus volcanicus TaxID=313075 RepID=UPI0023B83BE2|nr:WD repeat-containing protein 75 [Hylaeus volcanicus]XP_054008714.1 WD repeat-containing protein 75 [Hylaeus anthracinus]
MQMKLSARRSAAGIDVIEVDDLVLTRKGGGSIIDQRPLFSHDGETLYIVWKHVIRAYSTQTGDFVRELEPANHRIAGLIVHPENPNIVIACTENGELNFWSCQSGIITKKLKLKFQEDPKVKTFHIVNYKTHKGNELRQVLITYISKCCTKIYVALFDLDTGVCTKSTCILIDSHEYYVDIIGNHGDNLIAVLHDLDLHILNPARNLIDKQHKTGKTGRIPTCIAGHPEEECVATGDSTGRVVVWKSLFQTRPYTGVYHWHTLPVTEIAFSKSGGHMYTGGGECVLVKWVLANPQQKSFLPRLPAPIKHLTIAPDNLYVAVSTLDNGIVVVNPQKKLTSVIQNFTWGVALSSQELFPAGLVVDPRTNCLVLNSRTGHVQFYNTHTKSLLYNVNITAQNFLTQERSLIIVNTEVTKIALNHDGTWMATVEERNDKLSCVEVRLKFWMFDAKQQLFTLNTSIELPHEGGINALHFQPSTPFDEEEALAITTGRDKKFRLWHLIESSSTNKKTKHWQCHSIGDYRNLSVTDAGFSIDGSLVGIGFDSSVTMWTPDTCTFKCSLTHSQYQYPVTRIEFGRQEACHLVVAASTQHIAVWNILSLTLVWSVPLKVATLAADSKSTYMAVFTTDNSLFVFTPQKPSPVYTRPSVIENNCSILGATFVPHLQEKRDSSHRHWQRKSQLFFLDSNQELLTLEPESEVTISLETLSTSATVPSTAFGSMIAAKTTSSKETATPFVHEQLGVSGKGMVEELLSVSAHTLPHMKMLCTSFINSLLMSSTSKAQSADDKNDRDDRMNNIGESTDDSDDEFIRPEKSVSSPVVENNIADETKVTVVDRNWSFLATILPDQETIND